MPSNTGIRFVMEGPNAARIRLKKRARLVTACDACRSKKIKCLQLMPDTQCESCRLSGWECSFQDRDRFHAERGMTTVSSSAPSPPSSVSEESFAFGGITESPKSPVVSIWPSGVDLEGEQKLMQPFKRHLGPTAPSPGYHSSNSDDSSSPKLSRAESPVALNSAQSSKLFDPRRNFYPHPHLSIHLIEVFFDNLHCQFPFLQSGDVIGRAQSGTLPAVLTNAIAGLASRYSNAPELSGVSRYIAGEPFIQVAKMLVIQMLTVPSMDLLHAIILIAWAEYGSGRDSELFMYARMATAMLLDLGIQNPQTMKRAQDEAERDMLRLTWWSVAKIDLTSSWVNGRVSSLRDGHYDISLPSTQTLLFAYLTELFTIRKDIINYTNVDGAERLKQSPADDINDIQQRLSTFYRAMPDELTFNETNFRQFNDNGQGPLHLLLHLCFHGLNCFVNWPSLFKDFDESVPHSIQSAYASARAAVDTLRIAKGVDFSGLLGNPFFDMPISVTVKVLLAARKSLASSVAPNTLFTEASNDSAIQTCMSALTDLSKYWKGAAVVRAKLEAASAIEPPKLGDAAAVVPFSAIHFRNSDPRNSPTFSSAGSLSSHSTTSSSPHGPPFAPLPTLAEQDLRIAFANSTNNPALFSIGSEFNPTLYTDVFSSASGEGRDNVSEGYGNNGLGDSMFPSISGLNKEALTFLGSM